MTLKLHGGLNQRIVMNQYEKTLESISSVLVPATHDLNARKNVKSKEEADRIS